MPGRQAWLWCLSTFALAVLPPHAPATLADEERSRPSAINAVNFSSLTGSPDPRCTVRLPAIRTLWMTDALPIFFDAGQLAASPWKDYVTLVYGEPEFPIDMRCFTFFWKDHLPEAVRSQFESRYKAPDQPARDGDVYNIGSGELAWQIYLCLKRPTCCGVCRSSGAAVQKKSPCSWEAHPASLQRGKPMRLARSSDRLPMEHGLRGFTSTMTVRRRERTPRLTRGSVTSRRFAQ